MWLWVLLALALVAGVLALLTGHLTDGISFCTQHPEVMSAILIYSLSSAVGQNFIYYTVTEFGPLVLTTVTTTRKIFSTLYSVMRNPENSLSEMQWGGCSLVFAGLAIDVGAKYLAPKKPAPAAKEMTPATDNKPKPQRTKKAD